MEKRFRKVWLFTHNDLDGYACNIVARCFLHGHTGEIIESNCSYETLEYAIIKSIPTIEPDKDLVIVSDISWRKSTNQITEFMKSVPEGHLVVADHHKSSEWIGKELERPLIYTVEGILCGCQTLMHLLTVAGFQCTSKVKDDLVWFTDTVCDWDLWKWANKPEVKNQTSIGNLLYQPAPHLSAWFEWCLGYTSGSKFLDTVMLHLSAESRPLNRELQHEYMDRDFKDYLSDITSELFKASHSYYRLSIPCFMKNIETLLFVLPKGIQQKSLLSMVADRLVKNMGIYDYDCIAIWVEGDGNISLRYPTNGLDLSDALQSCVWGGGGHREQAGTYPGDGFMRLFCERNKSWKI